MIEITPRLFIDEAELEERFFRAGGPGGQNVNKVLLVSRHFLAMVVPFGHTA